jgi:hypothetical protein
MLRYGLLMTLVSSLVLAGLFYLFARIGYVG